MKSPRLTRLSGAGNTFLFWNLNDAPVPAEARSGVARFLCDGFTNFFTDGLVFVGPDSRGEVDFEWDFYNSDGSKAEMCGNAARCAVLYFQERMGGGDQARFRTAVGVVEGQRVADGVVEVLLPELKETGDFREFTAGRQKSEYFFMNLGVPHVIVESAPDEELARQLRHAPELGAGGSNVTFVSETTPGEMEAVTFERGVENFTLACGTGAVAAGAFSKLKNPLLKVHAIEMPGGSLRVEWKSDRRATLTGAAQIEFDLSFQEDLL